MFFLNLAIIAALFSWVVAFAFSIYQDRKDQVGWKMYDKEKERSDYLFKKNCELEDKIENLKNEKD